MKRRTKLTVKEIIEQYGVTKCTVYRWFRRGLDYEHRKTDGERVVDESVLKLFLEKEGLGK